jgi:hypothetical protein
MPHSLAKHIKQPDRELCNTAVRAMSDRVPSRPRTFERDADLLHDVGQGG